MQREQAARLMKQFAERTGLASSSAEQRYLWTDAFAVCNFLGLARDSDQSAYLDLVLRTVDRVHHVLGKYRKDDPRTGWISGLRGPEGEAHPTRGGLRIGKELPERGPDEPFDDRLEWERDGQYFHYLTQWMHALDRVSRSTKNPIYNSWARELAYTAFRAFTYVPFGASVRRMYWKMSVDLSRPLVKSMGQHDALDGYVTYLELSATASKLPNAPASPDVTGEAAEFASMVAASDLATTDPLGIGGLLIDAFRVGLLMNGGTIPDERLLERLLSAARQGIESYESARELRLPAERRLAFRELGLAIGLHAVEAMKRNAARGGRWSRESRATLESLASEVRLAEKIEYFWLDPDRQRSKSWTDHRNINEVMLATSLAPQGLLGFPSEADRSE